MKYLFLRVLPKNLISRLIGKFADLKLPTPFLLSLIQTYCYIYKINLDEMELNPIQLKSFNEFFTRKLKPGCRPVDPDPKSVVSPVDGTVAECGEIENRLLTQAKGIRYSLEDLVGEKDAAVFDQGFFVTIYLSPSDYHRIHSPVKGGVKHFSYFSGNLWPVNKFGVENIGGLFAINERIFTPIETKNGIVGLVKVGATVVGKIKMDYTDLTSNSKTAKQLHLPIIPEKQYEKGGEIGKFMLGSTVILLFQKGLIEPKELFEGKKVRMGEVIAHFTEAQ